MRTLASLARPTVAAALALAALAALPASAYAEQGEVALSVGPGLWAASATVGDAEIVSVAPTAALSARYGLDDFWQLGAALAAGVALSPDHEPAFVGHASVEAQLFIDVITWVAYAVAGGGALVREAHPDSLAGITAGPRLDATVHAGLGLDYRPARDWSVGGAVRYQLVITDLARTAPALDVALAYTFYFE